MYHNTLVYITLILFSICVAYFSNKRLSLQILVFFVTYYVLFAILDYLDIFPGWNIWKQHERTAECYDWLSHYLKKDYGIINGKTEFDLSESLYFNDYNASNEKALMNKYNLIFKELNLSKGKKLLDCGCGTGVWMDFCKKRGVEVVGLTLSVEQQKYIEGNGMTAYVQDYRVLDQKFVKQFDAVSVLGSSEHITNFSGMKRVKQDSYEAYKSLFKVLRQYLKSDVEGGEGKILLTVLVQGKPESERSGFYDRFQTYILCRMYGGYYSTTELISKAITDNGFVIDSVQDFTKDYHWISIAEPNHFGHWWIDWSEDPVDKIGYFFKGLLTDPFLIHRWFYYGMDTWMWSLGGYQKTPLTDLQVKNAVANLKYFSVSLPKKPESYEKGPTLPWSNHWN